MNKKLLSLSFIFIFSIAAVHAQTIQQHGYYDVNGIHALDAKPGFMILGNGDIVNISVPSSPVLTGNISLGGFSSSVLVDGHFVYFGMGMNVRLMIGHISNPAFPLLESYVNYPQFGGGIFGIAKKGNMLYLAMGNDGIHLIDVMNNGSPKIRDSLSLPNGQARDVVAKGNYAYVAHGDGLKIIDVTDPYNISLVTSIGSGYNSIAMDATNNLVFLGKSSGGVDVFNISDPLIPAAAFAIPNSGGTAWDLKYQYDHLYLATNSSGLFVYKIAGNAGTEVGHFQNTGNGQSFGVALQDSLIFLSGLIEGVAILQGDNLTKTGTGQELQTRDLEIFPNPTNGYIEFNGEIEYGSEIEITSLQGQCVFRMLYTSGENGIDISELTGGAYFVQIWNGNRILRKKLIKLGE